MEEMNNDELKTTLIDMYSILQQIKKDNNGHENKTLDYQIKVVTAKLSAMGFSVEDITL